MRHPFMDGSEDSRIILSGALKAPLSISRYDSLQGVEMIRRHTRFQPSDMTRPESGFERTPEVGSTS